MTKKRRHLPPETVVRTSHDVGPTLHGDFDDEVSTQPPRPKQIPSASFVKLETNIGGPNASLFEEELEPESLPEEPTEVAASKRDTSEDVHEDMKEKALKALALDPKISTWLRSNDPKAFAQVCAALGMELPRSGLNCPHCGRSAVVDLRDGSEILSSECLEGRCGRRPL